MSPDCPNPALPATLPADDPSPAQEAGAVPARRASEAQQRHDRLMREIEQLRERLQQWQQCESRYHERVARELQPELKRWCELCASWRCAWRARCSSTRRRASRSAARRG
jgi:hypothetical protein